MAKKLHYDFINDKSLVARVGPTLACTRALDTATRRNSSGVREAVLANVARFDHTAGGVSLGLLSEEARTNLFLNSDAPVTQGVTTTAKSYVVWMEGAGSVTLSGTGTGVATDGSPVVVICTAGTLTLTVAGGPDLVQVEAGTGPTSYIPTVGSAVLRNKDNISVIDATWFNAGGDGSSYSRATQTYSNATTDSFIVAICQSTSLKVSHYVQDAPLENGRTLTVGFASGLNNAYPAGVEVGHASAYSAGDLQAYFNGVAGNAASHTLSSTATVDRIWLGSQPASGGIGHFNGHIAEVRYYNTRLTNAELEAMSLGTFPSGGGSGRSGPGLTFGGMGRMGT